MTAPFDLTGRVAIVTGGASGIGVGIAEVLAEAGATVVIADVNGDGAATQAEALRAAGHRAGSVRIDLADEASIVAGCAQVLAEHGAPWVLVNNAGLQDRQRLLEATAVEWDRIQAVNARGPFLMTREVARAMVANGQGGRIVNIASAALNGQLVMGHLSYVASKGALAGMTIGAAIELVDDKITVNVVNPGSTITPGARGAKGPPLAGPGTRLAPLGFCDPRDIGAAVLYFASPAARLVTNQILSVDGGWTTI